jgi:hypothetical protein
MIALVAVAIGLAIYEIHQADSVCLETQNLRAQQTPLTEQISNLRASLGSLTNQLDVLLAENARLKTNSNPTELLKLRSEVTRLRPLQDDVATLQQMVKQSSAPFEWKTNEVADVGCATPAEALKTYIYSAQFNPAKLREGVVADNVDPPDQDDVQDVIESKRSHLRMTDAFWQIEGYKVLSQTWLGPGLAQVELESMVGGGGGAGVAETFTLRKVNGEWKLVVFNIRGKDGAVRTVDYWHEEP